MRADFKQIFADITDKSFRTILKLSVVSVLICVLSVLICAPVVAENVSSDNYQIQMGNVNMGAGVPASTSYRIGLTGGQNAPGLYSSTGYRVKAGFWYVLDRIPFAFTISDLTIDFGTLTAGTPSTQTNILSVSAGGAGGYQVTASESATLATTAGTATIPDTSCDGGANTCTATLAKPWTDNTKYGFGYNMFGNDITTDFIDSTYFRPFPIGYGATIMQNSEVGRNRTATVTYKINVSGSQTAGNYENYVIFVATPTY